jgi:hypothetical protein
MEEGEEDPAKFICPNCEKRYIYEATFVRHFQACQYSTRGRIKCPICSSYFSSKGNLTHHMNRMHSGTPRLFACGICTEAFESRDSVLKHREEHHVLSNSFYLVNSAHCKQTALYRLFFPSNVISIDEALLYTFEQTAPLIQTTLVFQRYIKVAIVMFVEMYKTGSEGEQTRTECFPFRADIFTVTLFTDFEKDLSRGLELIELTVAEFIYQGSGWRVLGPHYVDVTICECYPLEGGSGCGPHVASMQRKRGLTIEADENTAHNDDGACLYRAIASYFCGKDVDKIDAFLQDRGHPAGLFVSINDVEKVENDEKWGQELDFGVNILYKDEEGAVLPVRASRKLHAKHTIVLVLYHMPSDDGDVGKHYALVEDPERIFMHRRTTRTGNQYWRKLYTCWNCMNSQHTFDAHLAHKKFCMENDPGRVILPNPGDCIEFSKLSLDEGEASLDAKVFNSAYMLFFDLETLQQPARVPCSCTDQVLANTRKQRDEEEEWASMSETERLQVLTDLAVDASYSSDEEEHNLRSAAHSTLLAEFGHEVVERKPKRRRRIEKRRKDKPNRLKVCTHKTKKLFVHIPFMVSYVLVDRERNIVQEETITGLDCIEKFLEAIVEIQNRIRPSLSPGKPMMLNADQRRVLMEQTHCYLCEKRINFKSDKVIDHDHLTGAILGLAHNECNLKRRERQTLTCFAHNFSGFDSHCLIKAIANRKDLIPHISAIPLSTQKFKCVTLNRHIVLLDSYAFLPDKLGNLADALRKSDSPFTFLDDMVNNEGEKKLLLRKGVFPYSFATSIEKLEGATTLPPMSAFKNEIDGTDIEPADYVHAQTVWATFRPQNMAQYALIYCKTDVRILAEAIVDMREKIWRDFKLDLCAYLSLPMLTKDMMLKQTGISIELICDQEMSELLQKNIRGGLSYINTRSAGEGSLFELEEAALNQFWLFYLDANNLYGKGEC